MLHQLLFQVAQSGGEITILLVLVASVVSTAIISNRIWFLARHRIDVGLFARQLLQPLSRGDWPRARTIARRSSASVCVVITAGLSQIESGRYAVRTAMRSARLHEQNRLEGQLGMLAAVGRTALLLGLLGTIFDLLQFARGPMPLPAVARATAPVDGFDAIFIFAPIAAGLLVAIPALLASAILRVQVRFTLRQIDSVAQLLLLHVPIRRRGAVATQQPVHSQAA